MTDVAYSGQIQSTYYNCGPAALRCALTVHGLYPSQQELGAKLGTTINGTDSSNDIVRVANQYLGAGTYAAQFINGQDATAAETTQLKQRVVAGIDSGSAIVANVAGYTRPIGWSSDRSYPGGHYLVVVGYRNGGDEVHIYDNAIGQDYWLTVGALATWIATRGYSYPAVTVTAPTTSTPVLAGNPLDTMYLIDIASHQEGINLAACKAQGVQIVNIKTSQGMGYVWGNRIAYANAARAAGLSIMSFHWLDNSASGVDQARKAFALMRELGGTAHQCDCEDNATEQIARDYINEFQRLSGLPVLFYSGGWWLQPRGWNIASATPYLMAAPHENGKTFYPGTYPGDGSHLWTAGYGGFTELAAMQYAVEPMSPGTGGGNVSKTRIRVRAWQALAGITAVQLTEDEMKQAWLAQDHTGIAIVWLSDNIVLWQNIGSIEAIKPWNDLGVRGPYSVPSIALLGRKAD